MKKEESEETISSINDKEKTGILGSKSTDNVDKKVRGGDFVSGIP